MEAELQKLRDEVRALHIKVSRVQDEAEIRKIHFKYGYYLDKCLYKEVADLFSNHPDAFLEFLGGRYKQKEGIRRLFVDRFACNFVKGRNGPIHGFLLDHAMMQDIVDVDESGTRAWGRFRTLMSAGTHHDIMDNHPRGHAQWWESGLYENEYIKEDGIWKPFRYRYFAFWHADFESGWSHTKKNYVPFPTETYPQNPQGPDEIVESKTLWPETKVVPFHYPHPVTGQQVAVDDLRAPRYGEDVSTAGPPLSLAYPHNQEDHEKANGVKTNGVNTNGIKSNGVESNGVETNGVETNGINPKSSDLPDFQLKQETNGVGLENDPVVVGVEMIHPARMEE